MRKKASGTHPPHQSTAYAPTGRDAQDGLLKGGHIPISRPCEEAKPTRQSIRASGPAQRLSGLPRCARKDRSKCVVNGPVFQHLQDPARLSPLRTQGSRAKGTEHRACSMDSCFRRNDRSKCVVTGPALQHLQNPTRLSPLRTQGSRSQGHAAWSVWRGFLLAQE